MNISDEEYTDFSLSQKDTQILKRIVEAPQADLPLVPRTPKKTHLERLPLSGTTSVVMRVIRRLHVKRLHEYFEQSCDRYPHEVAAISGSSQLTYQELDRRANRLAYYLISNGIREGNPVGILLERSLDTYITLLGVLKAGATLVPLDPSLSADQTAFIIQDTGLRYIVTTSLCREKTSVLSCQVIELNQIYTDLSSQPETRPQIYVDPTSLCYILYTSDSTNQPKGVAISHTNIVNFLHVVTPIYGLSHNDRVYQGMSTAIGFSFQEIWPGWIAGATLVAGSTDRPRLGHGLTEFLIEHKITSLCCTPALLATIERDIASLRLLLLCGEACPGYLVSRWSLPRRRILNTYGYTETTVATTWHELFPNRPITLGSPLPTYQIYILDNQFSPVKDGEIGELFIGGPGVVMGYVNRPDLTEERFIPNPILHDRELMPRLYRTGDLGRTTAAGEIEYLGKVEAQVKSQSYSERGETEQIYLPQTYQISQFETTIIPDLETKPSKLGLLKQMSLKNFYQQIMTDPLYKNSIFNMASTFILGGLGFVFWIIIARLYKPENVGIATTLVSLMTLLSGFTIMGFNVSLNRYLPKSTDKNDLINSSFVITALAAIIGSAIFLLGLQIFSPQLLFLRSNIFYMTSFTIFVIFCSWNSLTDSVSMAFRAASNILIKNTTISLLKLLLPFALISFGAYGIFASAASALTLGVLSSLIILIIKFQIKPSISVNIPLIKKTAAYSFANFITDFMFYTPSLILPVIILNILSARYVAYYYVASMIQSILLIIPIATSQALLTEGSYNEHELRKHVKKALMTTLFILIPATSVIVFGGNILLQVFGKSYASEAFQFLRLYSISTIFTALLLISNAIMNVLHQMKALVFLNVVAAIITLWLSYAFISGKLLGIGWGWILGQAIAGAISIFFIVRNLYLKKGV